MVRILDTPGFGLDAELSLVKTDGTTIVTTARQQFMELELKRLSRHKPRFVVYALFNSADGVDVVVPNNKAYKDSAQNVAVCPPAFLLDRWMDLEITQSSMMEEIKKVFEPEQIRFALNNIGIDGDGTLYFLRGNDKTVNEDEQELLDLEWMTDTLERLSSNDAAGKNDYQSGDLYDFDDASDVASVATAAFVQHRYGQSFLDKLSQRGSPESASHADAAKVTAPAPGQGGLEPVV